MSERAHGSRGAVLITGASTGIGEACALHLDQRGFRIFAGVRRPADAEALRAKAGPRLAPLLLDVTDAASIAAARTEVERATGEAGLAGLVNNAGIAVAGPLEILPLREFRKQIEVNVTGALAVTQAFLPLLRRARGRIVQMGSISGRLATPFNGAYSMSKFALEAMTDALRIELLPWGLEVSIIEPGSVATPIWEKSQRYSGEMARQIPAERRELYRRAYDAMRDAARQAGEAGIRPREVARAVEHALTARKPKTRYLVGKNVRLYSWLAKFLPDRARDRMIARRLGLPTRP
jgi:NAD(P)-dependent dehydrogenase (short-subunit alcohol dehydrogenase family)